MSIPDLLSAQGLGGPDTGTASQARVDNPNHQTIGPGKVRFVQTRNGRWLELEPSWDHGASLIAGGGFAVFAEDAEGRIIMVANTGSSALVVSELTRKCAKHSEGTRGGFRAPSLDPDDDRDGFVDEDRLDGVDNDRDGAVDEDFAAIGDEMIVTGYFAGEGAKEVPLEFHQEAYAWSLPNIDGAIMLSVRIKNTGSEPLRGMRVAAYYDREGYFELAERTIEVPLESDRSRAVHAAALISGDGRGSALALVAFPLTGREGLENAGWSHDYVEAEEDLQVSVVGRIREDDRGASSPRPERISLDSETGGDDIIRVNNGGSVYSVSPATDRVDPGEEIRVDIALVAAPRPSLIEQAATNALQTYLGDGSNLYVPPPVSLTPRVIWGKYSAVPNDEHAVLIVLEELGDDPVGPERISYFSGLDPASVQTEATLSGATGLIIRGDAADNMLVNAERVKLKGRLDTGEFFEAILRPDDPSTPRELPSREAETISQLHNDFLRDPFRDRAGRWIAVALDRSL
jgi:hypothetical protein